MNDEKRKKKNIMDDEIEKDWRDKWNDERDKRKIERIKKNGMEKRWVGSEDLDD